MNIIRGHTLEEWQPTQSRDFPSKGSVSYPEEQHRLDTFQMVQSGIWIFPLHHHHQPYIWVTSPQQQEA